MPWITTLFRRRRPNLRTYLVDLPDGTKRSFDLESRTSIGNLLEVSLLSMSVPSHHHSMFCVLSPAAINPDDRRWLRSQKSLKRELKGLLLPITLHVKVLLYPRDHYSIDHRVAKHLLYSQVKEDFREGNLKCNNEVAIQLSGLVAQAELGNYSQVTLQESYMSQLNLMDLTSTSERQAIDQHKIRRDLSMEECIDEFLSISETLKGYGAHKFNVHDDQNRPAALACGPLGVEVHMGSIQTIQLHWESVTTINVHNRLINFQTESSYNQTGHLYSFRCSSVRLCKNIAVLCVNMRNYYCNSEVVRPTSKLRRLFSTRASRRRSTAQYNLRRNGSAVSSFSNPRFRSSRSTPTFHSSRLVREQNHITLTHTDTSTAPSSPHAPPSAPSTLNIMTASNGSSTASLMNQDRPSSVSPTSLDSPTFSVLPTLSETDHTPYRHTNHTAAPPKKASTLPTNMNPEEIMKFSYLGNQTGNHRDGTDHRYHNGPRKSESGRRLNGYHSHNGIGYGAHNSQGGTIDNFDCINELLDEGLENSNTTRRRERVSIGGEVDRRRVFPSESNGSHYYRNRSYTLQNPKRGALGDRRSSSSSRPFHRSTNSDPSKLYFSSVTSLHSINSNNVGVASMANQLSLATLSQDSSYIDPHIKSLVFEAGSSQPATEL